MTNPSLDCPRFQTCSVNNCPLHPDYPDLAVSPLDPERRCILGKTRRLQIAGRYQGVLRFGGLKAREFHTKQRLDSDPVEYAKIATRLKKSRSNPGFSGPFSKVVLGYPGAAK